MSAPAPTFIGIGAHKAGTTWLYEVLRSHPEVFMAPGKEPHYFAGRFDEGAAWYEEHFRDAGAAVAIGEFSTSYLAPDGIAAGRIAAFDPSLRLVASLRDPVDRALSHYRWLRALDGTLPPFEQALAVEPKIVEKSCYHRALVPFWDRFPDDQLLLVRFEDIVTSPAELQRRLFTFVGVDPSFASGSAGSVVGKTIAPRSRALHRLHRRTSSALKRGRLNRLRTVARDAGLTRIYYRINDRSTVEEEPVPDDVRARVFEQHFAADAAQLAARTGWDLSAWMLTSAR